MGERPRPQGRNIGIAYDDGVAVIDQLPPSSVTYLDCSAPLFIADRNAVELDAELHGRWDFGHGACWLNLGHSPWRAAGRLLPPLGFQVVFASGCEELRAMSRASSAEVTRLCLGHVERYTRRRRHPHAEARPQTPSRKESKRWRKTAR